MLTKAYDATAAVLAEVTDWSAPSPCAGWTVRDVANHLVDAMCTFAAAVDGGQGEYRGEDLPGAYREAADRCLAVFEDPAVLAASHPFPPGPTPGSVIARISLSESLVHGWDVARGAGVAYRPAPEVVDAVREFTAGPPPEEGMFAPPVVPSSDDPMTVLLAHLGRKA
ncbi:TIGR03086 family metal-binding protein [Actinophytocola glycyrrhizae]|uniref:TIGR03086 family metal-binding protein n=1 Tax=Actinophytocola glycyrrhizae TaxID=2044873 RepID=A0ABV9S0R8_9PSEU